MEANYNNPMIKKAYTALKALIADEKTRELAERREKALKDEVMFLNEAKRRGMEEGREENKKEMAVKLLKMKILTAEQIAEVTV